MSQSSIKTPVSLLQEYTAKNAIPNPKYEFLEDISKTGGHVNEFHYKVTVKDVSAVGSGSSKNTAKHNAASNALQLLQIEKGINEAKDNTNQNLNVKNEQKEDQRMEEQNQNSNFIGHLYELCAKLKLSPPAFFECIEDGPEGLGKFKCECKVNSMTTEATCFKKKEAKQLASKIMVEKIKNSNKVEEDTDKMEIDESGNIPENETMETNQVHNEINEDFNNSPNLGNNPVQNADIQMNAMKNWNKLNEDLSAELPKMAMITTVDSRLNYIGQLNEICAKLKISSPQYLDYGSPITRLYETQCTVDALTSYGAGYRRQDAKHLAAKNMMDEIKKMYPYIEFYNKSSLPQKKTTNEPEDKSLSGVIKRKMSEKNLSFNIFQNHFQSRNEENLKHILNLLEISYKIEICQESPPIATAVFDLGTPFTLMAIGTTKERAKINLISEIHVLLDIYMGVSDINSKPDDESEEGGSGEQ